MESIPFSIIIPVYNDEKNLPRCLDSVLSQTFTNFECLIIDDGSADNCPSICDGYAQKDVRVKVYHNQHMGISASRQFGLEKSMGTYIYFSDSDDWVEPDILEQSMQKIEQEKPDILFMDFFRGDTSGAKQYITQKPDTPDTKTITTSMLEGKLSSCLWNFIINRNFINNHSISFNENINYGEDSLFIIELLLNNPSIIYFDKAFYHHIHNENSFTRKNKKERYNERALFINQIPTLLKKYNRTELARYNFFPMNDKYEMLCSGNLSKTEYQVPFKISVHSYYSRKAGFRKYLLLNMAETFLYHPAKFIARTLHHFHKTNPQ